MRSSFTMPILLPTSSFKTTATVIIASVFSITAAVIFTVPSVSHFLASCFPIIYDNTVFLVKPPYLYLVINCIIVSIVATSKLTHKSFSNIDDTEFSEVAAPVTVVPVPTDIDVGYLNVAHVVSYTGYVENDVAPVEPKVEVVKKSPEAIADDDKLTINYSEDQQTEIEKPKPGSDSPEPETEEAKPKSDSLEVPVMKSTRKPPRFGQQKSLKNSPEAGNKKSALGVSKPPRSKQDTLETTWKKITEGRSTPLTKHLTKSDTWQERSHVQSSSSSSAIQKKKEKVTKSENLNDMDTPEKETLLNREPSPGQEELNRRVEAFIKKFNEEMRLQRLESLAKYNEMVVNGGTRL